MKIFLDDERAPPDGWTLVRWPEDVFAALETGEVTDLSLDHDLGDDERGTGYDVIVWVEEAVATRGLRPPSMRVHSANSSARDKMESGIRSIQRFAGKFSSIALPPPNPLPRRVGRMEISESEFGGAWSDRHWRNTPGPFYSTTWNDMCLMASGEAPEFVLYDDECEFVWRQPTSADDFEATLEAMSIDTVRSFGIDGNEHWSEELVRDWWSRLPELLEWTETHLRRPQDDPKRFLCGNRDSTDRKLIAAYRVFLKQTSRDYLQSYLFLLAEGRPPRDGELLPDLRG